MSDIDDINLQLQLKCQGMEEITLGLIRRPDYILPEDELEDLIDRAEAVIRLSNKLMKIKKG